MTVSPNDFWRLLAASGLLSARKLQSLRNKIQQHPEIAASTKKIAKQLLANNILTDEQLQQVLAGDIDQLDSQVDATPPVPKNTTSNPLPPLESSQSFAPDSAASDSYDGNSAMLANDPQVRKFSKSTRRTIAITAVTIPSMLLTAFGIWWFASRDGRNESATDLAAPIHTKVQPPQTDSTDIDKTDAPYQLTDSTEAIWARHEPGDPISLDWIPPGVQAIVHLRLADIWQHPEGQKILKSLGPTVQPMLTDWLSSIGYEASQLDSLTLAFLPQGTTLPQIVGIGSLKEKDLGSTANSDTANTDGATRSDSPSIHFVPSAPNTFIVGPPAVVKAIVDNRDVTAGEENSIYLRREMEHLRAESHSTDHVTVLANPNFLRDEASGLFAGPRRRLLDGLYGFWSEQAQAISIGMHLGDPRSSQIAVTEIRMIAREELPSRQLRIRVRRYIDALPMNVGDHLGSIELDPHWQRLAVRFPSMLRFVTQNTRVVAEGKQVSVSVALPAEAVHNLLLAAELTLISPERPSVATAVDRSDWTLAELLEQPISVRFAQKSLEFALQDVMNQVRDDYRELPFEFVIEIIGTDLQPEGITRNQQLSNFEVINKPLSQVLTQMVMKANPSQNVTSPTDEEQKLVWVPSNNEAGKILITTRDAVNRKGFALPAAFRP